MFDRRRWPRPWQFAVLILPFGMMIGINATPLPFLLANSGVPVDEIAEISALLPLPGFLVFLWAPLADTGLRRRTWIVAGVIATALPACVYFPLIGPSHLVTMTAFLLASGTGASISMVACGGLMARRILASQQAKASAWWQAGLLGGGTLGGAAILWLAMRVPLALVGIAVAFVMILLGLLANFVREPRPSPGPALFGRLARIRNALLLLMKSPQRRWSALLLASPAGTGAALGLLPAIASHFGVGAEGVIWMNGIGGGLLMALGALAGGLFPGTWDRRAMYTAAAGLNALALLVLLVGNNPLTYSVGTAFYLVSNGFCQTWFIALAAETVGRETAEASALFGAMNSVGTLPVMAMTFLDGMGYRFFGTNGLLATDAFASLSVCLIVLSSFAANALRSRQEPVDLAR